MRAILTTLILTALAVPPVSTNEVATELRIAPTIDLTTTPLRHTVIIRDEDDKGNGSGLLLRSNYILTCHHVAHDRGGLLVGFDEAPLEENPILVVGRYIRGWEDPDLALVGAPIDPIDPLVLNRARLDEEVIVVGFLAGAGKRFVVRGRVIRTEPGLLFLDINLRGGVSGAGVFNTRGECLGIIFAYVGEPTYHRLSLPISRDFFPLSIEVPDIVGRYFLAYDHDIIKQFIYGETNE
jgi:hypothetical protein